MVKEFLEGEDLACTLLREGPLPWERARPIVVRILAALQAAHDRQDRYASARDFADALLDDTNLGSPRDLLPGLRSLFRRR